MRKYYEIVVSERTMEKLYLLRKPCESDNDVLLRICKLAKQRVR
jgi:hypothetical protein